MIDASSQLSLTEQNELQACEQVIEHGLQTFYEVGQALMDIRDKKLYRGVYVNFEVYCLERWNFTGARARLFMRSAEVMDNLSKNETIVSFLPSNEAQARPLSKLEPEDQRVAWQAVVEAVGEGKITAAHVEATVKRVQNIKQGLLSLPDEYRESAAMLCGDNDEKISILQRLHKSAGSPETNGTFDEIMSTGGFHFGDEMDKWLNFKSATIEETRKALDSLIQFHVSLNYKRDMKTNRVGNEYVPQGYDACQTPAYAIEPLMPYLASHRIIWEPARGEGLLAAALEQSGLKVVGSDILTGQNFFEFEADPIYSAIVTNPPYSLKFKWLERCYQLGKPFALLLPVETLGAKTAQEMFKHYGAEFLLLNKRVSFKMPNKGWDGAGAQFPTMWVCWKLLPTTIVYGEITRGGDEVHE
jgi:hypothetical protein